jgi:peptidoglycan/xylan/chitin deacetylase (PgdA/CDA1 family)
LLLKRPAIFEVFKEHMLKLHTEKNSSIDCRMLLEGRYEAEHLPKDFSLEGIVPDFAFNVLNFLGLLYRPVADEDYLAMGGSKPVWPECKPFAVCLTHDVDIVSLNSFQQLARRHIQNFMNCASFMHRTKAIIGLGMDAVRAIEFTNTQNPLHCYERWLEVEKNAGARSTFFFWPGRRSVRKPHRTDCIYELTDQIAFDGQECTVADMIREIDRKGWEIGLHPSWNSFNDADEMKYQKDALERILGHDIVSVRQHRLHYDIRVTPSVQAEAGLRYDSTLGFNDNIGFRLGSCYPIQMYDLLAEKELPITEIPLIIQEGALLSPNKGMRLDEDTAFMYIEQLTEAVQRVGGILTLLWHPNYIVSPSLWHLYCHTLEYLKGKNAWFGAVRDVSMLPEESLPSVTNHQKR